jgi:DNA-binding transcriptional MerR regulator
MYSIKEFSTLIGVTTTTLRNWDKNGKLKPIVLPSGHRRYTEKHLNQILNNEISKN